MEPGRSTSNRVRGAAPSIHDDHLGLGTSLNESQIRRLNEVHSKLHMLEQGKDQGHNILKDAKERLLYYANLENARVYEDDLHGHDSEEYEDSGAESDETDNEDQEDAVQNLQYDGEQQVHMQQQNAVLGAKKKKKRGPTEMKKLWAKYGPENKINLDFNKKGQPCGLKTCKLTNFVGSLVKGKEVSMAARHWRKVPQSEKDKVWTLVKAFFNIDESYKPWVLKSASKKWRGFKAFLKSAYFDDRLSLKVNIKNGCDDRIPKEQWEWLVEHWKSEKSKELSYKNKTTREDQPNGTHTAGSRSFAVVQAQMELKEGRSVSRCELYRVTHTDKDGYPVDETAALKIAEINKQVEDNPALLEEEANDEELYTQLFPKAKTVKMHGLGLVVGGKTSEKFEQITAELHKSKSENKELRSMMEIILARSQKMEEQYKEITLFMASQRQKEAANDGNCKDQGQQSPKQATSQPEHNGLSQYDAEGMKISQGQHDGEEKKKIQEEQNRSQATSQHQQNEASITTNVERNYPTQDDLLNFGRSEVPSTGNKPYKNLAERRYPTQDHLLNFGRNEIPSTGIPNKPYKNQSERKYPTQDHLLNFGRNEIPSTGIPNKPYKNFLRKVKMEKVKECNAEELICSIAKGKSVNQKVSKKIQTTTYPEDGIKSGLEVGLKSPNSDQVVALGTIQKVHNDYVEVLVNIVLKESTILPQAQGRINKMGNAQAHSIQWPLQNLTSASSTISQAEVSSTPPAPSASTSAKDTKRVKRDSQAKKEAAPRKKPKMSKTAASQTG